MSGVPLIPLLGWGMTYGALALLAIAGAQGTLGAIGHSAAWWASRFDLGQDTHQAQQAVSWLRSGSGPP